MKHVVSLLMIALCASALQALTLSFTLPTISQGSYKLTYEDGTTAESGELLRVVFVTGGTLSDATQIPFTIDAAGQLISTTSDSVTVEWGNIYVGSNTTAQEAIPLVGAGKMTSAAVAAQTTDTSLTSAYAYLVLFDTRDSNGTATGSLVGSVAIAPFGSPSDSDAASVLIPFPVFAPVPAYIGHAEEDVEAYSCNLPGLSTYTFIPTSSWQDPAAITSLTVDGTTYDSSTSPTIDEYLTPAVSGLALDSSAGTVTLTGSSNDAIFYTIETTDSLSGTWVSLTEFLTSSGKTLDTATQMLYSRMRLDKSGTAIEIPILEGDTARFYRFEPIGSSNSSSEE